MDKLLYQSDFSKLYLEERHQLLRQVWLENSRYLTQQRYRREMEVMRSITWLHKVERLLGDARLFYYIISEEEQAWVHAHITDGTETVRRLAVLVSADAFAQQSIDQLMERVSARNFDTRYFLEEQEAQAWLLEC